MLAFSASGPWADIVTALTDLLGVIPGWLQVLFGLVGVLVALLFLVNRLIIESEKPLAFATTAVQRWRGSQAALSRRRSFARHLQSQLDSLSDRLDWNDDRFADLEAEVEVEGRRRRSFFLPGRAPVSTLRRVRSLAAALASSSETHIILRGAPGAGKSVALRHVASQLAEKARRGGDEPLPLYLNLKNFRPPSHPVTADHVHDFVLDSLRATRTREVDSYLDNEFDAEMTAGRCVFLFDSFDEIPEILSSVDTADVISDYAFGLRDFLQQYGGCRGVVASREFKGPQRFGWPRFTIAPLTRAQRADLISRSGLSDVQVSQVIAGLSDTPASFERLFDNPMLLSMLCDHVLATGAFPASTHSVFESFMTQRLAHDAESMRTRFSLAPAELRHFAEELSMAMTTYPGLGLGPTRRALAVAVDSLHLTAPDFHRLVDALEYTKIAMPSGVSVAPDERVFTLAHRRYQEYFATCVVLNDPGRVPAVHLLSQGQWRETAVTILQSRPDEDVAPLLAVAERLLVADMIADEVDMPVDDGSFVWPGLTSHLLDVLAEGLSGRDRGLSPATATVVSAFLDRAWVSGARHDQVWVLQGLSLAETELQNRLMDDALDGDSELLRDTAFAEAGRMRQLPSSLRLDIGHNLVVRWAARTLRRDRLTVHAQLSRLSDAREILATMRLLLWASAISLAMIVCWSAYVCWVMRDSPTALRWFVGTLLVTFMSANVLARKYLFRRLRRVRNISVEDQIAFLHLCVNMTMLASVSLVLSRTPWVTLWPTIGVIAGGIFAIVWLPSVLWHARAGRRTSFGWWVLLPVLAPFRVVAPLRALLEQIPVWLAELRDDVHKRALVIRAAVAFVALSLVLGSPNLYFMYIADSELQDDLLDVALFAVGAMMPVVLIAIYVNVVILAGVWRKQRRDMRRLATIDSSDLNDLQDRLAEFETSEGIGAVVARLRRSGDAAPAVVDALNEFVRDIEDRSDGVRVVDPPDFVQLGRSLLPPWPVRQRPLTRLDERVLDDIARLAVERRRVRMGSSDARHPSAAA